MQMTKEDLAANPSSGALSNPSSLAQPMRGKARLHYKIANQLSRGATSWSFCEAIGIRVWSLAWFVFARWTPKKFNVWRLLLLRLFGAKIVGEPFVFSSARIYAPWNVEFHEGACVGPNVNLYSLGKIILLERCVLSQESMLCGGTHDLTSPQLPLQIGDIEIGKDVFVGMRAFILPGVKIGDEAVVGAMAVVTKDVTPHQIVAGNPASVIGERCIKCESVS